MEKSHVSFTHGRRIEHGTAEMMMEKKAQYLLITFLGAMVLLQALSMAVRVPLGAPPDEIAHISFIQNVIEAGNFLPDYAATTNIKGREFNALSHPPLFYSLNALLGRLFALSPLEDYIFFRCVNAGFVTVGFVLLMLGALRLKVDEIKLVALTMACLATPMFGYLAGSINNDNLVYLGVSLFFYGVMRSELLESRFDGISGLALASGLTIVALTKITGSAFLVFFCVFYMLFNRSVAFELLKKQLGEFQIVF